jgi:hypothetical protein
MRSSLGLLSVSNSNGASIMSIDATSDAVTSFRASLRRFLLARWLCSPPPQHLLYTPPRRLPSRAGASNYIPSRWARWFGEAELGGTPLLGSERHDAEGELSGALWQRRKGGRELDGETQERWGMQREWVPLAHAPFIHRMGATVENGEGKWVFTAFLDFDRRPREHWTSAGALVECDDQCLKIWRSEKKIGVTESDFYINF